MFWSILTLTALVWSGFLKLESNIDWGRTRRSCACASVMLPCIGPRSCMSTRRSCRALKPLALGAPVRGLLVQYNQPGSKKFAGSPANLVDMLPRYRPRRIRTSTRPRNHVEHTPRTPLWPKWVSKPTPLEHLAARVAGLTQLRQHGASYFVPYCWGKFPCW